MKANLILWWGSDRTFSTYDYIGIYPSTDLLSANIVDAGYTTPEEIINEKTIAGRILKITKARRFVELNIPVFYNVANTGKTLEIESFIHAPYKRIFISTSDFPGQDVLASFVNGNTINLITDSVDVENWSDKRNHKLYKIKLLEEDNTYNII